MDSILQYLLNSADEAERERLLSNLVLVEAAPLIRKVLRQRLGFYLSHMGTNPTNPDAEDLYQEVLTKLLHRLSVFLANPESHPINNYRNLVISSAINACNDYLRAKSPARARLKNNLRDLLLRHRDFALWKGTSHEQLCGFAIQMGTTGSDETTERCEQLIEHPDVFRLAGKDLQRLPLTRVVAEILNQIGGPIELDVMTELLVVLLGIREQRVESIEQEEASEWQFADPAIRSDVHLEGQESLRKLWEEIKQLPPKQRDVICLSLADSNGDDLFSVLLQAEAMSFAQIAADLSISFSQLAELLSQLPMDNATLTAYLGTTPAQVNKWRFRGLQRLRERLIERK